MAVIATLTLRCGNHLSNGDALWSNGTRGTAIHQLTVVAGVAETLAKVTPDNYQRYLGS